MVLEHSDTSPFLGTGDIFGKYLFYNEERVKFETVTLQESIDVLDSSRHGRL